MTVNKKANIDFNSNSEVKTIGDYEFHFQCEIEPKLQEDGCVEKFYPQPEYKNKKALPLHEYGEGAFCKFSVCLPENSGVYLMVVDKIIVYIGETYNLRERFNNGYGNISPRNCYKGGQSTNCRINKNVLTLCKEGKKVRIYVYITDERKHVERKLISLVNPPWNKKR